MCNIELLSHWAYFYKIKFSINSFGFFDQIVGLAQSFRWMWTRTTDTRWLNPWYFATQIQIQIWDLDKKALFLCRNNSWLMELTVPKWVLINRPKVPQMPQNLTAHIVCLSPNVWYFDEKRLHLGVRSLWMTACFSLEKVFSPLLKHCTFLLI